MTNNKNLFELHLERIFDNKKTIDKKSKINL